jgi:hypothetical protein
MSPSLRDSAGCTTGCCGFFKRFPTEIAPV